MIVWILGSMASGKTTLNKGLFEILCSSTLPFEERKIEVVAGEEGGVNYMYTKSYNVASIGQLKQGVATCGIDPVMGKLKTEGVELSIRKANQDCEFVIIEGAQAAYTWFDFVEKIDPEFLLIHLNISYDDNIKRLKLRQFIKANNRNPINNEHLELSISNRNYDSVLGKNKQYSNIWDKVQGRVKNMVQIDATLSQRKVLETACESILNIIK